MNRIRGGIVFKAQRLLYRSTLGLRAIQGGADLSGSQSLAPILLRLPRRTQVNLQCTAVLFKSPLCSNRRFKNDAPHGASTTWCIVLETLVRAQSTSENYRLARQIDFRQPLQRLWRGGEQQCQNCQTSKPGRDGAARHTRRGEEGLPRQQHVT